MQDFVVTKFEGVTFPPDSVLALTDDQLRRRRMLAFAPEDAADLGLDADLLGKVTEAFGDRRLVRAVAHVAFKLGETVGVVACGDLNKRFLEAVSPERTEAAERAVAKAKRWKAESAEKAEEKDALARAKKEARAARKKAGSRQKPPAKRRPKKAALLAKDETAADANVGKSAMEPAGGPAKQKTAE